MKRNYPSTWFKISLLIIFIFADSYLVFSQEAENLNVLDRWRAWSDGANMLMQHLNKQAFNYLDIRDKEIQALNTRADWEKRQAKVKETLMKTVGPLPDKTPLNPKITGIVKKEGYNVEKIIYESMPGFYVTGALFVPLGKEKKPAILFVSGHTNNGFRANSYQNMILNLVKKGFIVFAIDPISQGERVQHYDTSKNGSAVGADSPTREHSYLGNQTFLSGVSVARYFIWDGIRAIDYLLTRKEVDPQRIGITGQSGGGTQAAYIYAFDERIKAGAPVNYITGFRRLLESIGPQDAEQNLYHGIINGLTHADFLEVRAPAPVLIAAGTRDFFSIQGARETYAEVYNTYRAFGKEENLNIVEDDFGHGYTTKLNEAIYAFFQKNLNNPGSSNDEKVTILSSEELKISPTGNIATSYPDAETVFSINKKESQKLVELLQQSRAKRFEHNEKIIREAKELSGYISPERDVKSVFRGRYQRDGYVVELYALQGEGSCVIPILMFIPEKGRELTPLIYLHPEGKMTDAGMGGRIERLVKKGYLVAAPDLSGIGEITDKNGGNNFLAMLIGRSLVGIQAADITRIANFLKQRQDIDPEKIEAIAFDEICPSLVHAAAFNKLFSTVILFDPLISYQDIVMTKFYEARYTDSFVSGALKAYDLPDLMSSLPHGNLTLINVMDGEGNAIKQDQKNSSMELVKSAWQRNNSGGQLKVLFGNSDDYLLNYPNN